MTIIHFVKDGKRSNGERITRTVDVDFEIVKEKLCQFDLPHTITPPTINGEIQASDLSPYKHVVVEIGAGETADVFQSAGFYFVTGLEPCHCCELLGIQVQGI